MLHVGRKGGVSVYGREGARLCIVPLHLASQEQQDYAGDTSMSNQIQSFEVTETTYFNC